MENPIWQGLSIVADMMALNLLTLLCSLPVVTAGAALTAMNGTVIRILRGSEGSGVARSFFSEFRQNLKNGILLGLLLLMAAGLLCFDYLAALAYVPSLRFGIAAIGVLLLALAIYAFALLARYDRSLPGTLKNAAALAVAYFPQTLWMLCFCAAFWLLCITFIRWGAPILFLFGLSLPCYVCIALMKKMFNQLEKEDGTDEH